MTDSMPVPVKFIFLNLLPPVNRLSILKSLLLDCLARRCTKHSPDSIAARYFPAISLSSSACSWVVTSPILSALLMPKQMLDIFGVFCGEPLSAAGASSSLLSATGPDVAVTGPAVMETSTLRLAEVTSASSPLVRRSALSLSSASSSAVLFNSAGFGSLLPFSLVLF